MSPISRRERFLIEDEEQSYEQFLEKWDERHADKEADEEEDESDAGNQTDAD